MKRRLHRYKEVDGRGPVGWRLCLIHWDPDSPAESAHHMKAPGFCRVSHWANIPLICFPSSRRAQVSYAVVKNAQKTLPAAIINHYGFSVAGALINRGTKSLQNSPPCPGANNRGGSPCQLMTTACKLKPRGILSTLPRPAQLCHCRPANRGQRTDPEAQQHLALPLLLVARG